jgi:serine protease DegQ
MKAINLHKKRLIISLIYGVLTFSLCFIFPFHIPPLIFNEKPAFTPEQLQKIAQNITVQVLDNNEGIGTGFFIEKKAQVYRILTNDHVLQSDTKKYQVKTFDGQIYPAKQVFTQLSKNERDLAMLEFSAPKHNYQIAKFGQGKINDQVYAAGFPFLFDDDNQKNPVKNPVKNNFVFNQGKIRFILTKEMKGGYQIGYTNDIQKGMSGGPLINDQGQVIAINGMHAYPLWGDPYIYQDGSSPEPNLHQQMERYSWGIPIDIFTKIYYDKK